MTYDTSDPAAIERELAEARARLDARLERLERRLSPGQLVDSGLDYLRQGQGAAFVRNLGAEVRDNPLPVVLTGLGLAWLMGASALSWERHREVARMAAQSAGVADPFYDDAAARAQLAGESLPRLADESDEAFGIRVAEARASILGVQRDASETAPGFIERVQQALETARQNTQRRLEQMRQAGRDWGSAASDWGSNVSDQTRRAGEAVGQAAQQSRELATRAGRSIAETVNQNPLLLGALGLAAGALLGALVPTTDQEKALVAPAGGAIRRAAGEALDRGARAADAAAEAAYQEIAGK